MAFVQVTDPVRVWELLEAGLMWFKWEEGSELQWAYKTPSDPTTPEEFIKAYAECMDNGTIYGYMTEE